MATFLDSMTTKSSKSLEEKTSNGCQKDKESKEQTVAIKDKISNNESVSDVPDNTDDNRFEQSVSSNVNGEGEDTSGNMVNGTSCVDKGGVSEGLHTDDDQNVVSYEFLQVEREKLRQELQDMKQMVLIKILTLINVYMYITLCRKIPFRKLLKGYAILLHQYIVLLTQHIDVILLLLT